MAFISSTTEQFRTEYLEGDSNRSPILMVGSEVATLKSQLPFLRELRNQTRRSVAAIGMRDQQHATVDQYRNYITQQENQLRETHDRRGVMGIGVNLGGYMLMNAALTGRVQFAALEAINPIPVEGLAQFSFKSESIDTINQARRDAFYKKEKLNVFIKHPTARGTADMYFRGLDLSDNDATAVHNDFMGVSSELMRGMGRLPGRSDIPTLLLAGRNGTTTLNGYALTASTFDTSLAAETFRTNGIVQFNGPQYPFATPSTSAEVLRATLTYIDALSNNGVIDTTIE